MSLGSVSPSAPPYVHCSTYGWAGCFPFLLSSPFLSVILFCSFASVVHGFSLFMFSPLLLFPAALAVAADPGHSVTAQWKHPSGSAFSSYSLPSKSPPQNSLESSSSTILCEQEVYGLPEYYAVVVDSGSTGTRAFVYKVRVEPGTCGDVRRVVPGESGEASRISSAAESAENGSPVVGDNSVFQPLSRAIVQVPALATRRIGPGIALFAKRETGRKPEFEDLLGIENMTEERMRRELLEDEHLILEHENAEEQEHRERQRGATRRGKATTAAAGDALSNEEEGTAASAEASHERFGRQEDVEESLEKYLGELKDFVLETVPAAARENNRAFLFFRGTAGMRALPLEQQQKLLERVRALLSTWGLLLPAGAAGASVLSGAEEGVLGWVALNQLLGNFHSNDVLLNFAANHHRLCPSQQASQQEPEGTGRDVTSSRSSNNHSRSNRYEKADSAMRSEHNISDIRKTSDNNSNTSSGGNPWRAGLVEMGGASAQVVFQPPAEVRAANLLTSPFLVPPAVATVGVDGAADEPTAASSTKDSGTSSSPGRHSSSSITKTNNINEHHQHNNEFMPGEQWEGGTQHNYSQGVLHPVEPSERQFRMGETKPYPPVRRHRGPYSTEDFFEVDLCSSRHVVYSKSFLGLGRQHALMQHIHESVSEAMEKRRRQMEEGGELVPTPVFPIEAAVPCLPADVRVHVTPSPGAVPMFDEDLSKMVQEEQQDIEEHAAAVAASATFTRQVRHQQQRPRRRSSVSTEAEERSSYIGKEKGGSAEDDGEKIGADEDVMEDGSTKTQNERKGGNLLTKTTHREKRKSKSGGVFPRAAGAAAEGDVKGQDDEGSNIKILALSSPTEEDDEQSDVEENNGGGKEESNGEEKSDGEDTTKLARMKKLPRPGVAEQVLFKEKDANALQEIESVAAQGTSDGTACMHKMAKTMMRVGRLPFEIHRDMQLYATENFYHFNEAHGNPHFTVDEFSREGRKLCVLQQVEEVHKRLHPGAAREKAQTACFGLLFMSEFLRRVVGVERNRVLLAVNDLHDVEISWTAAVPMLYMPHVLLHHNSEVTGATPIERHVASAAAAAGGAAAPTPTVAVPAPSPIAARDAFSAAASNNALATQTNEGLERSVQIGPSSSEAAAGINDTAGGGGAAAAGEGGAATATTTTASAPVAPVGLQAVHEEL